MKASLNKDCMHDMLAVLEAGLAMKMGNNMRTKCLQTSIDFFITILDEKNEVKVCGLECKSRLTHSTQQCAVAQLMSGSGACCKVKWDDECLNYHVPSFHKKAQIFHHAVVCDLDIILLLVGK